MAAAPGSETSAHYVSPRFIGRRAERATLTQALAMLRAGEGTVVVIEGEAGIGKSRLLDEGLREARSNGARVLVGGCVRLHDDAAPLAPIAEALRNLAAETPPAELPGLLGSAREVLAGLLPGLTDPVGVEPRSALAQPSAQQRLHAHLVDLLARLARNKPLILAVEDIHWADAATLELLSLLVHHLRELPFALLATFRTDESDQEVNPTSFLAELERVARPIHIRLQRFNHGEVTEQIAAIRGSVNVQPGLVDDILARSEGNPFFTEELLAAPASDSLIPANLDEVLRVRLGALSESARLIVGAAAVRSNESTEEELSAVTRLEDRDLARALHELLDRKIFERRVAGGREVLTFRHALLRSAAYHELLASERRKLHLAYADLLSGNAASSDDPFALAEIARHLEAAGDYSRALAAALDAGAAAEVAYQPDLARDEYERALRQFDRVRPDELNRSVDRVDVLERAARAAAALGSATSTEHITAALTLVDAKTDPVRAGLLYERRGRYRWFRADGEGALADYREAVRLVPSDPPSRARARATAGLAQILMILARFPESTPYAEEALSNARVVGDRETEAHATDTMGTTIAYLGDPDGGLKMIWSANALAAEQGNVEEVARSFANLIDVLVMAGRHQQAVDLGRETYVYCVEHGLEAQYGASQLVYAAWALQIIGRWDEALELLDQARARPMDASSEIMGLAVGAAIEACRGDVETAEAHLELVRPQMAEAIDTQLLLPVAEAEAEVALASNRPTQALEAATRGIARAERVVGGNFKRYGPVYGLGLRAAADALARATDAIEQDEVRAQAADLMAQVAVAQGQINADDAIHLKLAEPYVALCRAEMSRVEGASDPGAWTRAVDLLSTLGRRHTAAYAQWRQAEAELQQHGRTPEVEVLLAQAHEVALELRADPLRQAIESLARRSRARLETSNAGPEDDQQARFGLTPREIEVLRLVAAGMTNREIGDSLFISNKTASVHVSNVLAKLGASRRSEAAVVAERMGLGPEESA